MKTKDRKARKTLFRKRLRRDRQLILIGLPSVLVLFVFSYVPMVGVLTAFQNFSFRKSFFELEWVGLKWFKQFFNSMFFTRVVRNTFILSFWSLLFSMVFCILFALLMNELKDGIFKRITQSLSYLPYFVSVAVVVGLMATMLDPNNGVINLSLQRFFGMEAFDFFKREEWFRPLYIISGLWQGVGWGSIIYLGSISSVDPTLYEAAAMDGCGRLKRVWHITLPAMKPVVVTMLLLNIGNLLNVGYQKVLLMYSPSIYETADVISTFVYRQGIGQAEFSFGAAVGLFNSAVSLVLLVVANQLAKKLTDNSLF